MGGAYSGDHVNTPGCLRCVWQKRRIKEAAGHMNEEEEDCVDVMEMIGNGGG